MNFSLLPLEFPVHFSFFPVFFVRQVKEKIDFPFDFRHIFPRFKFSGFFVVFPCFSVFFMQFCTFIRTQPYRFRVLTSICILKYNITSLHF